MVNWNIKPIESVNDRYNRRILELRKKGLSFKKIGYRLRPMISAAAVYKRWVLLLESRKVIAPNTAKAVNITNVTFQTQ